ncbi:MAG: hypothetical protein ACRD4B_00480, partial [Acidobacteriota bacterium]
YTTTTGYKILALFMLLVIAIIGIISFSIDKTYEIPKKLTISKPSRLWTKVRCIQVLYGGVGMLQSFFPTIIVLYLLGNEDTLGTLQSISAAITAFIVYAVAKSLNTRHRMILVNGSFIAALVGVIFFSLFYNTTLGIFMYFAAVSFMMPLLWIAFHSLNFDVIDKEDIQNQTHYAYLADQEIFLNIGRLIALGAFFFLLTMETDMLALRLLPLILAGSHILLIVVTRSVEKHITNDTT